MILCAECGLWPQAVAASQVAWGYRSRRILDEDCGVVVTPCGAGEVAIGGEDGNAGGQGDRLCECVLCQRYLRSSRTS